MANANEADFLGLGMTGAPAVKAPAKRATSADGLTYLDDGSYTPLYYERIRRITESQSRTRDANIASGRIAPDGRSFSEAVAGGGYQDGKGYVKAPGRDTGEFVSDIWRVPAGVAVAPIDATLGKVPGIDNTVRGVTRAVRNAPAEAIKEGVNNPATALATGGYSAIFAGADRAFDDVATGLGRDISGDDKLTINAPLTPGQLYDPNGPVYRDSNRTVQQPGVKQIFEAVPGIVDRIGGAVTTPGPDIPQRGAGAVTQQGAGATGTAGQGYTDAARVRSIADQYAAEQTAAAAGYGAQASAGPRAAPQMAAPSSAAQQNVLNQAANFQPDSGGVAGIRAASADTSGANALSSFQGDQRGISNLESFRSDSTAGGIADLRAFQANGALRGAAALDSFRSEEGAQGVANLESFNNDSTRAYAGGLAGFRSAQQGVDALNQFANQAEGPSRAEALLRAQADKDKRTAIAIARSARGGPAAVAAAMRQAQSEGAAISAETRGQASALRAQEYDTFKQRQLSALAQAGSLLSASEAQRLQAAVASGQMLSAADQQKLQSVVSAAEARTQMDAQRLSATQASAQVRTAADAQRLSATQSAGQLAAEVDKNALSATTSAAGLRAQADATRVNALSTAANVKLQGSAINQQGQIAATQAELAASGQKLQAMSLQGQIASDIRNQDIQVLRANLDASLQQIGLDDQQTRFFTQMKQDATNAAQNVRLQAEQMGISAEAAERALQLQWAEFAEGQLRNDQQVALQEYAIRAGVASSNKDMLGKLLLGVASL